MGNNNSFLEHVYVVNSAQIGKDLPSIVAVSITNPCVSICSLDIALPSIVAVSITNPCVSICDVVPIAVSVTNPCISICDFTGVIGVSVTNPCISICEPVGVNINIDGEPTSGGNVSALVSANKVYSFPINVNQASSALDNPLILIKNPLASGKVFYWYKLSFGLTISNNLTNFKIWASPTITANGTAGTPVSNNIGGGAPASVIEIYSLPTISSNGTLLHTFISGQNQNSINIVDDFSILLQDNNDLLITGRPESNNRVAAITMVWAEI